MQAFRHKNRLRIRQNTVASFSPRLHKSDKTCMHWSVVSYGDYKWLPAGVNEHTKLTLADRTALRMLQYIIPACPKWESYIFCRVEYGDNLGGIHSNVVNKRQKWNLSGLSEDDVWRDINKVISDNTALIIAGNSAEKAYKLLANSWRESIFLKYEYRQLRQMSILWNFNGKSIIWHSLLQGGDLMTLRFSENLKHDPLQITGTKAG